MKKHLKFIIISIVIFILAVLGFLFNPFKKGGSNLVLNKDQDYNVLVITLDTTRADGLGCYGNAAAQTPNMDSLAAQGVVFKNCYASVPITLPSHCSLFTGKQPIAHGIRNNSTYVLDKNEITLAEILQEKGYNTAAVLASFVLEAKFGLNQGFNIYDDSLDYKTAFTSAQNEIPADRVYAKFSQWFSTHYNSKFFCWLHFYDPHYPYNPPAQYLERFKEKPYLGEISFVDEYIGKIIEDLRSQQVLERTIIIITGDHGEAFGEHQEYGHSIFCYEENLKVPLIFYNPTIFPKGKAIHRRVQLIDVMPTLLELFNWKMPALMQGTSLLSFINAENTDKPDSLIYFESMHGKDFMNWAPLTGIIWDNFKYISLPRAELYDLIQDPQEKNNLYLQKRNTVVKNMDEKLRKYLLSQSGAGSSTRAQLTPTDKKRLESLGYITTTSSSNTTTAIMDPKEGIIFFNKINDAKHKISRGEVNEAETLLKQLMIDKPELKMTHLYDTLLMLFKSKKDQVQVEKCLQEAITAFPDLNDYKIQLAKCYAETGREAAAEKLCKEMLRGNSLDAQALVLLGSLMNKKGNPQEALTTLDHALKMEPSNIQYQIEYAETLLAAKRVPECTTIIDQIMKNNDFLNAVESLDLKVRVGVILLQMNQFNQVLALYPRSTTATPRDARILSQLGMAYAGLGNTQEALKSYEAALALDPKNDLALSSLGTFYLTQFRNTQNMEFQRTAVDYYTRAINANPKMVAAINGLAVAYSFVGDRQKAVQFWEKALQINPDFSNIYFNLGITYLKLGQKKNALKYLQQCKNRLYSSLSSQEQMQLDRLIMEASL